MKCRPWDLEILVRAVNERSRTFSKNCSKSSSPFALHKTQITALVRQWHNMLPLLVTNWNYHATWLIPHTLPHLFHLLQKTSKILNNQNWVFILKHLQTVALLMVDGCIWHVMFECIICVLQTKNTYQLISTETILYKDTTNSAHAICQLTNTNTCKSQWKATITNKLRENISYFTYLRLWQCHTRKPS